MKHGKLPTTPAMWKFSFKCAFIFIIGAAQGFDYCEIECEMGKHTLCLHSSNQPGAACGATSGIEGLSQQHKDDILKAHNDFRLQVARGKVFGQPRASNMNKMYWDDELALIAQRWADQCMFKHDRCRNTRENSSVGQNLAFKLSSWKMSEESTFGLQGWKDEAKHMTRKLIANFDQPFNGKEIGHYTQMVWAKSTSVGCGYSEFPYTEGNSSDDGGLVVCNYEPAGNVKGSPVYKQGWPCSACDTFTCSAAYSGLCVNAADTDVGEYNAVSPLFTLGVSILLVATQFFLRWS